MSLVALLLQPHNRSGARQRGSQPRSGVNAVKLHGRLRRKSASGKLRPPKSTPGRARPWRKPHCSSEAHSCDAVLLIVRWWCGCRTTTTFEEEARCGRGQRVKPRGFQACTQAPASGRPPNFSGNVFESSVHDIAKRGGNACPLKRRWWKEVFVDGSTQATSQLSDETFHVKQRV